MAARILIVEDNRVVARDIGQQLVRIGYEVSGVFARGADAVKFSQEVGTDLVLMDIRLEGEIDGIDAAEQIRNTCRVPVVFLTAYADDETVKRASETEPYGYLIKPFEDQQLRTAIEMALYKHASEQKLRESERRYAATLESIGDGVIAIDGAANITFMNPVAETLTGWSFEKAMNRPVAEMFRIVNEATRDKVEDPAVTALKLGKRVELAPQTLLIAQDGRERPIDVCGAPIAADYGVITGAVLVFRDMTQRYHAELELRKAQEELSRMSRVTTLGELTVTIAHEINQPLMAIVTNAAACLRWLSDQQMNLIEARAAAERVIRDGHRAGDVVATIRSHAKKSAPDIKPLNLNAQVEHVLTLIRGEFRRQSISEELVLPDEPAIVLGDAVQLQQVILNLVSNAIEAIERAYNNPKRLKICLQQNTPGTVMCSISDSGIGLDVQSADRIYDAFYTTKAGGIGMGLSICRSILSAHGGSLWATPNDDYGATFYFTLPSIMDPVANV